MGALPMAENGVPRFPGQVKAADTEKERRWRSAPGEIGCDGF